MEEIKNEKSGYRIRVNVFLVFSVLLLLQSREVVKVLGYDGDISRSR